MCVVGVQDDETLVAIGQGGGTEDQPHEQNEVKTFHRKGIEFMKTEKDGKASEYKTYEEEAISNVDDYVDVYPIIRNCHCECSQF